MRLSWVMCGAIALVGCGSAMGLADAGGATDAGGARDAGAGPDAGPEALDAGEVDAGEADAAPLDAGAAIDCAGLDPDSGNTRLTLEFDGRTRTFHMHVPEAGAGAPRPLVFDFHGFTSNAAQQWTLSGMRAKADEEGFVVVHAEGIGLSRSWNGGDVCCGTAASQDADDVGLVRAMIEDVAGRVCVDRDRVYATGFSNGGFLSHRLACEASDVIAAIAPVSGVLGMPMAECEPERAMPVLHIHGTSDAVVPYGGSALSGFPSVRETIDGWAARNGCTDLPEITLRDGNSECETLDECTDGVVVELCTIEGEGHWWPGATGSVAALSATDHMWDFFVAHPRP